MLIGCVGAYCALWPITDDAGRWIAFAVLVLLMGAFWISDGLSERRAAATQAAREQKEDASTREIQRHLREQIPDEGSLKERTLAMAMRIYAFQANRATQEPDWLERMRGLTGDALRDEYFRFGEFHAETLNLYQQRFGRRVSSLLEELFGAGLISRDAVLNARTCSSDLELHDRVVQLLYRTGQAL